MRRLTLSLLLDALMLGSFAALMSWRLTGIAIHEWLGAGLFGAVLVHLLLHGRWVETRAPRLLRTGTLRGRLNVLLNFSLFVAMGTALASGLFISKVVFPDKLPVPDYLAWHGLHDTASTLAMIIVGLHVALNWDLIAGGVRRALRGSAEAPPRTGTVPGTAPAARAAAIARGRLAWTFIRRVAWIAVAFFALMTVLWFGGQQLPRPDMSRMQPRGDRPGARGLPGDPTKVRDGTRRPSLPGGAPRFVINAAMLAAVALAGRKILKLRLE